MSANALKNKKKREAKKAKQESAENVIWLLNYVSTQSSAWYFTLTVFLVEPAVLDYYYF